MNNHTRTCETATHHICTPSLRSALTGVPLSTPSTHSRFHCKSLSYAARLVSSMIARLRLTFKILLLRDFLVLFTSTPTYIRLSRCVLIRPARRSTSMSRVEFEGVRSMEMQLGAAMAMSGLALDLGDLRLLRTSWCLFLAAKPQFCALTLGSVSSRMLFGCS